MDWITELVRVILIQEDVKVIFWLLAFIEVGQVIGPRRAITSWSLIPYIGHIVFYPLE
jgi:hypothetical protein